MRTELNEFIQAMKALSEYLSSDATEKELEAFAKGYPFDMSFDELFLECKEWNRQVAKEIGDYQQTKDYLRYANDYHGFRAEAITCIKPKPTEDQVKQLWHDLQLNPNPENFHFQTAYDVQIKGMEVGEVYYNKLKGQVKPTTESGYNSGGGHYHKAFRLIDGNWILYHEVSDEVWKTEQGYLTEDEMWEKFMEDEMPYKVIFSEEMKINVSYEDI